MKIIFSRTAVINGIGTQPYKWVSHLSPGERQAVRDGSALVFARNYRTHHYTQSGYKVVSCYATSRGSYRYIHREPNEDEIKMINRFFSGGG